ncbi:MAG: hypothetical protein LBL24_06980 [Bacteroidales bacterium]|jgi:hypothetical protein|nr:hypothetical protein [Bacteroidales bacterium]
MGIIKKVLPHAVAVVLFVLATMVYFSPVFFDGKQLRQGDVLHSNGSSQEIVEYRERTGQEALWTNAVFGGMPAYQISVRYHGSWLPYLSAFLSLGMPSPTYMIFFALLGFYIMLLCFRVNPWLAIAGAFAYGLSTYFMLIAGAGHNTKMRAMAYMPAIIGGLYLAYVRRKIWLGVLVVCLALGLQIRANHLQITYYTGIIVLIFIIFEFVRIIREKDYSSFVKTSAAMVIAVALAVGVNITNMLLTVEYTSYSTRGQSELTDETGDQTGGLDRSYILGGYSYGISETMDLFIPSFAGGPISADAAKKSPLYDALVKRGYPRNTATDAARYLTYWGGQERGTAGPVYLGAVIVFLFVLGLFVMKGQVKWWLFTATILSIALAWGQHFGFLSNLFIDYFPMYDKFRTVSMILTIAMLTVPLLGILAVNEMLGSNLTVADKLKALRKSTLITGIIALLFALAPGLFFSFEAASDANYQEWIIPLRDTREWALRTDAFRSFVFVLGTAAVLWLTMKGKLKPAPAIALLTALIVIDLWTVDKRYLNDSSFKPKGVNTAQPTPVDLDILQDKDPNYRVLNLSVDPFNDATTSFFHKSIGGYHGAKMKRYQELIERYIGKGNMAVLNMLNTKYFIVAGKETGQLMKQANPGALGNAWPAGNIKWVDNADAEIAALGEFDPSSEAVVDKRYQPALEGFIARDDSTASINLVSYEPNHLVYEYHSQIPQLIVFSEIFYDKGWNAYIDGELTPHIRADYVLRAMAVPAGKHEIVFRFEPVNYARGEKIALASSVGVVLLILGVAAKEYLGYRKKRILSKA